MKKICGLLTLLVGIVMALYSFFAAADGDGGGFWLLVIVGILLSYTGVRVMKSE